MKSMKRYYLFSLHLEGLRQGDLRRDAGTLTRFSGLNDRGPTAGCSGAVFAYRLNLIDFPGIFRTENNIESICDEWGLVLARALYNTKT